MSMSERVLCRVDEVPTIGALAIDLTEADLLLTRDGGEVRAFHNVCPHAGRRLDWSFGKFLVERGELVCAAHGATFEPATGRCTSGPAKGSALRPIAVRIEDGAVLLVEPRADFDGIPV